MFLSGWNPGAERKAKDAWKDSPPRFGADVFKDIDVSDVTFTLADQVKFWYDQGPVGSCFANATTASIETGISYAIANGAAFQDVNLSRRAVWYFGRSLDGTIGTRGDGGSITNAVRAIHDYGIPAEADWPYKPDHDWLEVKPPASVIQSAKAISIKGMLALQYTDTVGIKRSIKSGLPPVIGIWWPYGWDTTFDQNACVTEIGRGEFGHALVLLGWATWKGVLYWHIQNSHGPIYPNLKTTQANGYVGAPSGKSYAFWCPDSYLRQVANYGNAEMVAPVTVIAPSNHNALSWLESN